MDRKTLLNNFDIAVKVVKYGREVSREAARRARGGLPERTTAFLLFLEICADLGVNTAAVLIQDEIDNEEV